MQTQSPIQISLSNQSRVYKVFGENEKLTIAEVVLRVNGEPEPSEKLSERTIRRAIDGLVKSGFLKTYGKQNNATLYGLLSASYTDSQQRLINFNGELLGVGEFLKTITDPQGKPLQKGKTAVIDKKADHVIRKLLTFAIMSAGEPGYNTQLKEVAIQLRNALAQLEFASGVLKNFLDSPVWYEQYRDQIGRSLREVQEKDPDLFQLANDFMKGG